MADTIASAKIGLEFDSKKLSSSISSADKDINAGLSKIGSGAAKVGKVVATTFAAAGIAAATSVAGMVSQATKLYADYEQLTGGIETLFGDAYDTVMANADRAFMTAGLSANGYMETVTSFSASLLQGLGGDTAKAAQQADLALTDMADNANKMGTSMEAIQVAYQGFAKQNYTMLDNLKLGYGGTKQEMERLMKDAEKLTGVKYDVSNFSDIVSAIHAVQTELGITGTTAKEAATTIQGSWGSLKSAWTNLLTGMADESQNIGPLMENLATTAGTFLSNLLPVVETALSSVVGLIDTLVPKLVEAIPGLVATLIPALIQAGVSIVNAVAAQLPALINVLKDVLIQQFPTLLNGVITLFMAFVDAIPIIVNALVEALPLVIETLVSTITSPDFLTQLLEAAITLLMSLVDAIPTVLVALIDALPTILDNIISWLTNPSTIGMLLNAAVQLFMALVMAVPQILGALIGAFGTLVGNLWNGITSMFGEFAGKFGEFISGIFKGAINGVLGFIENFINTPINLINGFLDIINGAFGWLGVNIGHIQTIQLPRLAEGGIAASGGTAAIIGEAGTEAVLPLQNNTDNWSGLLADTLLDAMEERGGAGVNENGSQTIVFNITNTNGLDESALSEMVVRKIRQTS